VDIEKPTRKRNLPSPGPERVVDRTAVDQFEPEITPEGLRSLADFVLLLAKWDRMLSSSQSDLPPVTHREAA
jgi:hypothetical protein